MLNSRYLMLDVWSCSVVSTSMIAILLVRELPKVMKALVREL